MKYEVIVIEKFDGNIVNIKSIDENGKTWCFPLEGSNAMYQQYLIDTDGGLPIPEEKSK
jgi:hypothetical protein